MSNTTRSTKPVAFSAIVAKVAERRGIDPVEAGKKVRAYVRRHDAELRESFNYPPEEKERADGNRYPAAPRPAAKHLIEACS